jgi:hypothetical protein
MNTCTCGWKKPVICWVSFENASFPKEHLLVVAVCPECKEVYDAGEQERKTIDPSIVHSVESFVKDRFRLWLSRRADA